MSSVSVYVSLHKLYISKTLLVLQVFLALLLGLHQKGTGKYSTVVSILYHQAINMLELINLVLIFVTIRGCKQFRSQ